MIGLKLSGLVPIKVKPRPMQPNSLRKLGAHVPSVFLSLGSAVSMLPCLQQYDNIAIIRKR